MELNVSGMHLQIHGQTFPLLSPAMLYTSTHMDCAIRELHILIILMLLASGKIVTTMITSNRVLHGLKSSRGTDMSWDSYSGM